MLLMLVWFIDDDEAAVQGRIRGDYLRLISNQFTPSYGHHQTLQYHTLILLYMTLPHYHLSNPQ